MASTESERRRRALEQLSRSRLGELTEALGLAVQDRRSPAAHVEAILAAPAVDLRELFGRLRREELQDICGALELDAGGREKAGLVGRIVASLDGESKPLVLSVQDTPASKAPREPRARRKRGGGAEGAVGDYRHDATRLNNPPAGQVDYDKPPKEPTRTYAYDPHLDPQLVWAGKAEHTSFDVDTVSLHIHERVSTQAILRVVRREDAQRSLFAESELPESKAIDFYQHEVGWSNRLMLGDSLLVMNSLLEREHMAGKVQCIYLDPPYGVKFNSNFQPSISRRDVKDGDDASLTREPEQIQAYRDTWSLGLHSYLTYLRDRLLLARELLGGGSSIFVQISEENVHHVRELMDEIFGSDNFCSLIVAKKTGGQTSVLLPRVADYLLWYARDRSSIKYRQMYHEKEAGLGEGSGARYDRVDNSGRAYQLTSLISAGFRENTTVPFKFQGKTYHPGSNSNWKTTVEGLERLAAAERIEARASTIAYVRYVEDFPAYPITSVWADVAGAPDKMYVVQTSQSVIARCLLMTTDPGDLVLDPTCGSGTTAFVAEQWGRRWITCDTSRVALAIARQRLLTSKYPYYRLRSDRVKDGFHYKTVPHITLKSIAQNTKLDACKTQEERERVIRDSADQEVLYDQPEEDRSRVRVSGPFTVEAIPVASMEDPAASPIPQVESAEGVREAAEPYRPSDAGSDYVGMMIDLVRKTGVHFPNNRHLPLSGLRPVRGPYEYLHAEANTAVDKDDDDPRRVAISFGSRHGPVTPVQVRDAIQQTRGYDIVLFIGFACDPEARKMIDLGAHGRELQFAHAAPDILVGDLLKTPKATKLFTVFGAPDVRVRKENGGAMVTVELAGVDLYDPSTGETHHTKGDTAAAWFVDHDYDGRTFCVCQAFFPGGGAKNPWEKLARALKGTIDEEKFEALRTTKSLPFKPGKRIAVKVIDDRGNEVVKLVDPR